MLWLRLVTYVCMLHSLAYVYKSESFISASVSLCLRFTSSRACLIAFMTSLLQLEVRLAALSQVERARPSVGHTCTSGSFTCQMECRKSIVDHCTFLEAI